MSNQKEAAIPAKKNDKYKVIPNLSLSGKDILRRMKNGTLKVNADGQYSLLEEIDAVRRMSKIDIKLAAQTAAQKSAQLKSAIVQQQMAAQKAAQQNSNTNQNTNNNE